MISKNIKHAIKNLPAFQRLVYEACLTIPRGEVRTYGWIAKRIGHPGAARAVGSALAKNPFAPTVPCHRVVCSDGRIGFYSGTGGTTTKKKLLMEEGLNFLKNSIVKCENTRQILSK